jgi:hypothetical protein
MAAFFQLITFELEPARYFSHQDKMAGQRPAMTLPGT